jgi:hypothetical protein
MSSTSPRDIWYRLVEADTGQPYRDTSADKVRLSNDSDVADFRKTVHVENPNKLSSVDASDLIVYKNQDSFDKRSATNEEEKGGPLKSSTVLNHLGDTEEEALIVVVPSSRSAIRETGQIPNTNRKMRWEELNKILEGNAKKYKNDATTSTAYSDVTWNQVKTVFNPTNYVQPTLQMNNSQLSFLEEYLSKAIKCFGGIVTGKEAKRLHFIAPILICVCDLLGGDVDILVEEDLVGNVVKAHGYFEFMLRRGNKAVCIVEAKKDDFDQGMAQDLVGCEVAAEVGGLHIVYGIVTNFIQWNFLCSRDDKVQCEVCSLRILPHGPERDSLKSIAEKIHAMLSSSPS